MILRIVTRDFLSIVKLRFNVLLNNRTNLHLEQFCNFEGIFCVILDLNTKSTEENRYKCDISFVFYDDFLEMNQYNNIQINLIQKYNRQF